MAAGDVISQLVVEKQSLQNYDAMRSGRFLVYGFCVAVSTVKPRYNTNFGDGEKWHCSEVILTKNHF